MEKQKSCHTCSDSGVLKVAHCTCAIRKILSSFPSLHVRVLVGRVTCKKPCGLDRSFRFRYAKTFPRFTIDHLASSTTSTSPTQQLTTTPQMQHPLHTERTIVAMSSPSPPHDSPIDDSPPSDPRSKTAAHATAASTNPTIPVKQTPTPPQPPAKRSRPSARDSFRTAPGIKSAREVKEDLSEMGFTAQRVKQIGGQKETRLADGQMSNRRLEQAAGMGQGRAKREGKGRAKDYEDLRLGKDGSKSTATRMMLEDLAGC